MVEEYDTDQRITWECKNCDHSWKGKPKRARVNSGNPTCSSCGRRSAVRIKPTIIPAANDLDHIEEEAESPLKASSALLAVALKLASDRLGGNHDEVM